MMNCLYGNAGTSLCSFIPCEKNNLLSYFGECGLQRRNPPSFLQCKSRCRCGRFSCPGNPWPTPCYPGNEAWQQRAPDRSRCTFALKSIWPVAEWRKRKKGAPEVGVGHFNDLGLDSNNTASLEASPRWEQSLELCRGELIRTTGRPGVQ